MRSLLIYLNDSAGKGQARRVLRELVPILTSYGWSFEVLDDGKVPGHDGGKGGAIGESLSSCDYQAILVIGGDGTVHHVVNEVIKGCFAVPIAVIPVGTGNDFARQCGLVGLGGAELIRLLSEESPTRVDVISVNGHFGVQVLSTGFDAAVSKRARSLSKLLGPSRYLWALLLTLKAKESTTGFDYEVDYDGQRFVRRALLVAVANGKNYGGGMLISPNSSNTDGFLEIVVIDPLPRWKLLFLFPRIFSGSHIHHPAVQVIRANRIHLRTRSVVEMDGEPIFDGEVALDIATESAKVWSLR